MSSGMRVLVKVLVTLVCYGAFLALAVYAVNQIFNGNDSFLATIVLLIIAIFGFKATKSLPFFYATGGGMDSVAVSLFLVFLRIIISVFAGVIVAPWVIARKVASLIPGGEANEVEDLD